MWMVASLLVVYEGERSALLLFVLFARILLCWICPGMFFMNSYVGSFARLCKFVMKGFVSSSSKSQLILCCSQVECLITRECENTVTFLTNIHH